MAGQSNNNRLGLLEETISAQRNTITNLIARLTRAEAAIKELEDVVIAKIQFPATTDISAPSPPGVVMSTTTTLLKRWVEKTPPRHDLILG